MYTVGNSPSSKFKNVRDFQVDIKRLPRLVRAVSDIGIDFSIVSPGSKKGVSVTDSSFDEFYDVFMPKDVTDVEIPYFDKEAPSKREFLNEFASNPEIEFILFTIANEAIVYDDFKYFCRANIDSKYFSDDIKSDVEKQFKRIYTMLNFNKGREAWKRFLKWMIEGNLAWEIIYEYVSEEEYVKMKSEKVALLEKLDASIRKLPDGDSKLEDLVKKKKKEKGEYDRMRDLSEFLVTKEERAYIAENFQYKKDDEKDPLKEKYIPVKVLGLEPMDPLTLIPVDVNIQYVDGDGRKQKRRTKLWKQVVDEKDTRILADNQVVYVSYNNIPGSKRITSYTERLIRNFNLTRKLEDGRVAWNIMNSMMRLKMLLPVGNRTTAKAKQALKVFTNRYREEVFVDERSGQISVNGQPKVNYAKNWVFPKRSGESPEVEGMALTGADLSNMDSVNYFKKNMWRDSVVPYGRFDRENARGVFSLFKGDGIPYDEMYFFRFVNMLRDEFDVCIRKPLRMQVLLDHPELRIDPELESSIGITYDSNSMFEKARKQEIDAKNLASIEALESKVEVDGSTPMFSKKYLYVKKFELMTEDEWNENIKMRNEEVETAKAAAAGK